MKKTVYTLFLLICLLFCQPLQSAVAEGREAEQTDAFRIERKGFESGEISLSYIFPVNTKLLEKEGITSEEIAVYKFYLTTYVNALAKSNAEKEYPGVEVQNAKYFESVDGIGFSILFENLDAQKRFFGVNENSSTENKNKLKTNGLFIKRTEICTSFPVASKKSAGDLKMVCLLALSSWTQNSELSSEKKEAVLKNYDNSQFVYDFAVQEKGLKSEIMYEDEEFYHNVFVKSLDEIESDPEIVFWVESVNTPVWYILALSIVLVGMVAAGVVVKMRKQKKKQR